jgi:hypothetical protein
MVENTTKNINSFINSLILSEGKHLDVKVKIIKLNSKFINESVILLDKNIDSIATE